jgi:hypothetical protein
MASIEFNPNFGDLSSTGTKNVTETLKDRRGWVEDRNHKWNYKRTAYFNLSSYDGTAASVDANEKETVFFLMSVNNFSGPNAIGKGFSGGYLTAFHDDYTTNKDIRRLKPKFDSATISVNGAGDILNAYIREVTVNFTVYTQDDLDKVEESFFLPGARAKVSYGWLGFTNDDNLKGELEIRIVNFGFTMGNDGSYSCNIKGLTPGYFLDSQTAAVAPNLTTEEKKITGGTGESSEVASLPQSIINMALQAFGDKPDAQPKIDVLGQMTETYRAYSGGGGTSVGSYTFYKTIMMSKDESDTNWWPNVDTRIHPYYFISFWDLLAIIQEKIPAAQRTFEFSSDNADLEIIHQHWPDVSNDYHVNGSADPRKFILPGRYAIYDDPNNATVTGAGHNKQAADLYEFISNILINVNVINAIYKEIFKEGEKMEDPHFTPKTITLLTKISRQINRVTGGLVDIQIIKSDDTNTNKYILFNKQAVQKNKPPQAPPTTEMFRTLAENSIVKGVDLSSDFDVDLMMLMSISKVKDGEAAIGPIKATYPSTRTAKLSDIKPRDGSTTYRAKITKIGEGAKKTKLAMVRDGIDDAVVASLADAYRKGFTMLSNASSGTKHTSGTSPVLPFYLKLGITIDGVDNIGFLEPITIDRLPKTFQQTNTSVRFLVTGLEHTFDENGNWDTKIDTAMKIGV